MSPESGAGIISTEEVERSVGLGELGDGISSDKVERSERSELGDGILSTEVVGGFFSEA